jgi:hypothetical protein
MSPRTVSLPTTDKAMWRKLLALCHPDAGGDHETFLWVTSLKEEILEEGNGQAPYVPPPRPSPPPPRAEQTDPDAVPFTDYHADEDFAENIALILDLPGTLPEPYARALKLLEDCEEAHHGLPHKQQAKGATYKQLAAIGHALGMSKSQRVKWYRIAEGIPLSRRHAGHILSKLKGKG